MGIERPTDDGADASSVRVALRIRPQTAGEVSERCGDCIVCIPNEPQVVIGKDRAFTYDYVFPSAASQDNVMCDGYNATLMAYGQTGSGKTYTMGSGSFVSLLEHEHGMIPRVLHALYTRMQGRNVSFRASFVEIHNEEIKDLLAGTDAPRPQVRDDGSGGVMLSGAIEEAVASQQAAIKLLERGSLGRATGSTMMNDQSSRSHAIFTLYLTQNSDDGTAGLESKLHFVDLAGSERVKRTKTTGERFKEGISINGGLLALGNVICALTDEKKRAAHVPYRDSKLTRMLQDSLGGNSRTLMIACVSPADVNFEETLNTLKYADRARAIKNKPVVNHTPESPEMAILRRQVDQLKLELVQARSLVSHKVSDMAFSAETDMWKQKVDILQREVAALSGELGKTRGQRDRFRAKIVELSGSAPVEDDLPASREPDDEEGIVNLQQRIIDQLQGELRNKNMELISHGAGGVFTPIDSPLVLDAGAPESSVTAAELASMTEEELDNLYEQTVVGLQEAALASRAELRDQQELESLGGEIAAKEQLVTELQKSHQEMTVMRDRYESRLHSLQDEIRQLETARDKALQEANSKQSVSAEERRRLREHYEKKLSTLVSQLSEQQRRQKDFARMQQMQSEYTKRMDTLKNEILHMKQQHVSLTKRSREEAKTREEAAAETRREILRLKKEKTDADRRVAVLQENVQQKDQLLRIRLDQIHQAHKRLRGRDLAPSSVRPSSPERESSGPASTPLLMDRSTAPARSAYNSASAAAPRLPTDKRQWVSRTVSRLLKQRDASDHYDHHLRSREQLLRELQQIEKKYNVLAARNKENTNSGEDELELQSLADRREAIEEELRYKDEVIKNTQKERIDADKGTDLFTLTSNLNVGDARELVRVSVEEAVRLSSVVKQKDARLRQLHEDVQKAQSIVDAAEKARREAIISVTEAQRQAVVEKQFLLEHIEWAKMAPMSDEKTQMTLQLQAEEMGYLRSTNQDLYTRLDGLEKSLVQAKKERDQLQAELVKSGSTKPSSSASKSSSSASQPMPPPLSVKDVPAPKPAVPRLALPAAERDARRPVVLDSAPPVVTVQLQMDKEKSEKAEKTGPVLPKVPLLALHKLQGLSTDSSTTEKSMIKAPLPAPSSSVPSTGTGASERDPSPPTAASKRIANAISGSYSAQFHERMERDRTTAAPLTERSERPQTAPAPAIDLQAPLTDRPSTRAGFQSAASQSSIGGVNVFSRLTDRTHFTGIHRHASEKALPEGVVEDVTSPVVVDQPSAPVSLQPTTPRGERRSVEAPMNRVPSRSSSKTRKTTTEVAAVVPTLSSSVQPMPTRDDPIDLAAPQAVQTLEGHAGHVLSLAVISDALASGGQDLIVRIWDGEQAMCLRELQGHASPVCAIAGCGGSQLLAAGGRSMKLWDVRVPTCVRTVATSSPVLTLLSLGDHVLSGHDDGTIKVWNIKEHNKCVQTITVHKSSVFSLTLGEKMFFSASRDHTVQGFDINTRELVDTLYPVHRDAVQAVCVAGKSVFSAGRDKTVMTWDSDAMQLVRAVNKHDEWVLALAASPDSSMVFSGSRDGVVAQWEVPSGLYKGKFLAHRDAAVTSIVATDRGLFTASSDRLIKLWRA